MEIATSLLDAARNHPEEANRIGSLHQLTDILLQSENPLLVTEFFCQWPDLQKSSSIAFRQQLPEIVRKIGTKASGNRREAVLALKALLNDGAPEVVRQSISNATLLFRTPLDGKVDTLYDEQSLIQNFITDVSGLVHRQEVSDGVIFVAVKFLEKIILLLADGHAEEASKNLGFLLELLTAKFAVLKTSVGIVVIKSVGEIAKQRPEFCGRVLQVLVDLNSDVKSAHGHIGSLIFALKTAFLALLRCSHWGALPWRDRLLAVLRGMNFGEAAELAIRRADRALKERKGQTRQAISSKKKAIAEMTWKQKADVAEEGLAPALQKLTVQQPELDQESEKGSLNGSSRHVYKVVMAPVHVDQAVTDPVHVDQVVVAPVRVDKAIADSVHVDERTDLVRQIIAVIGSLMEEGEKGCKSIESLISKMNPDLLADVVIANMSNLPGSPADMSVLPRLI